ncbi:hypothetical protein BV22DRAFT_927629 [Leucogyrophana mollusca]|uniref:Uncharacterized protein n=1 Tax=Leucogyrophana mollusca TaxID=85980 RepID=A0ACB8AWQ1_9AGAM|nr:hypothetical protein BV22DRAFT_927629 [Leucogyrophana mollusca]
MSAARETVIIPADLGWAVDYDHHLFQLTRRKPRNSFEKGELFVQASLAELNNIKRMSGDAAINVQEDIEAAKRQYDQLVLRRSALKRQRETITFNPLKRIAACKDARLFQAAAERLFWLTQTTSDSIKRSLLSVPFGDVAPAADGTVSPGERISGISIPLDGPFDEETAREISEVANGIAAQNPLTESVADVYSISSYYFGSVGDTSDDANSSNIPKEGSVDAATLIAPQPVNGSSVNASTLVVPQPVSSASGVHSELSPTSRSSSPQIINNYYIMNSLLSHNSSVTHPTLNAGTNNHGATTNQQVLLPSEPSDNNASPPPPPHPPIWSCGR